MSQGVDRWRCASCDEIIGVYEPMVILLPSGSRTTSRAAERDLADVPEARFHQACFDSAHGAGTRESRAGDATPAAGG